MSQIVKQGPAIDTSHQFDICTISEIRKVPETENIYQITLTNKRDKSEILYTIDNGLFFAHKWDKDYNEIYHKQLSRYDIKMQIDIAVQWTCRYDMTSRNNGIKFRNLL